ncbi:unnamed protein product [Effrenium voratum]|nr:unnamed protein product [Effrenium voratum]
MSDEVSGALRELVAAVGPVLQHFVTREGRLVDLSCMITDADCEPQPLHSDTSLERVKFTVFLALQEVTAPMGPTMLCPQTHNWESHGALENIKQMGLPHGDILQRFGAQPALCEEGDVVIMNSQLLHCGGGQALGAGSIHKNQDELVGQYRLGHFDQGPPLTSEIDEEYNRLFTAANKLNDADKMLEFGLLLREREDLGALAWLRRACRKGHPLACMHLAEIYCLGELGLEKDMDKAEQLRSYAMELHEFRKQKRLYEAESDSSKDSTEVSEHLAEPELPPCLRKPTLNSITQRRTLASMVSLSLNSPQLLRATRAYKPLVHFGAVFRDRRSTRNGFGRSSSMSQSQRDPETGAPQLRKMDSFDDYMLSFQTRYIDQFWSHSWRASTRKKVLVLLLYYNQGAAVCFSVLAGVAALILRGMNILPEFLKVESVLGGEYSYAAWTSIFGMMAFLVVLFMWRPTQRVFLDKVCIHQKDPVLKKEGVESIGAFLYHSKTMLVLWDPSYATRLWCVFEMAAFAWAHRNDLKNRVEIRPVIFAPVYFGLMMSSSIINWALICFFPKTLTLSVTFWPALESLICILGVHYLRSFHRDMTILRQHLAEFQVANSHCYCCSVQHKMPETGERISCDRDIIQACIVTWFGSLADFDNFVQAELAGYFWRSLGHFGLPYRWVVGSQLPVLWAYMDLIADGIQKQDSWYSAAMILEALTMWLCASPLVVAFVIWVTNLFQKKRTYMVCDLMVSGLAALLTLVPFVVLTFMWYLSRYAISSANPLPGAVVFFIVSAELTTLTFKWGRSNCLACC